MTQSFSFEHEGTFEKGETTGELKLGKFEVHYEEIFAEVTTGAEGKSLSTFLRDPDGNLVEIKVY